VSDPDRRYDPPGIPDGWFAVAWSKDLPEGGVERVHCFGEDLVLFRTRTGDVRVLDAYCPHLGAHLAEGGRVMGESIRCPFHGWQYDGDGNCVAIPYCKRIPRAARVRSWPTAERNEMILVWHHAQGKPPSWEVPAMPEFSDPDWTEPRHFDLKVEVHMQEMAENNCDPAHFQFVHGNMAIPESQISYGDDGRYMRIVSGNEVETPAGIFNMALERESWGLGVTSVRMTGIGDAGLMMFSSTSPVDRRNTWSRWAFSVSRNMADVAGEEFIDSMSKGVLQDMRIWQNKVYRPEPVLCEADVYLAEFRRWTKQFYSDPASAD
jgi:nitrite reductase/ring-hydroxylating ferredoxin subunit